MTSGTTASTDAVFLVNGGYGSAAGERAERIAVALGDTAAHVAYRPAGRADGIRAMARALRTHNPAVAYSMDLAMAPLAAWLLAGARQPFMVDTGDAPLAFLELIGASRPARLAARQLERIGYGRASRIIVRGEHHATMLHAEGHHHVSVIPDGVDLSFFAPVNVADLRSQLGLDDALTVGVQGNFTWFPQLGGGIGWDLVEAMGRNPDLAVRAVIIGDGPGVTQLRILAAKYGIEDRLHVMGRVPYPELPAYLSLCDVTLLTQTNDPSSWVRTTGKLPGYLAAGRHILASRVGTAADLLPDDMLIDYHGHWDPTYPDRLARRLRELATDRDATVRRGLEMCPLAEAFDYDLIARRCADEVRAVAAA